MIRSLRPYQLVVDISIAAVCCMLEVLIGHAGSQVSLVALVGMAIALAIRRLSPTLALGIAWLTSLAQVVFNIGPDPSNLAILPVLYATASYGSQVVKWAGLISSGVGAFIITAYLTFGALPFINIPGGISDLARTFFQFAVIFVSALAAFTLSWTLGLLAKTWRNARESTQARILAERARIDAQQSVVVEQERNRIARDMHDVVAHSLAVVIAQADGARYAREKDPKAVDAALATISSTAREALGDVRILLGRLRHSQPDAPQPVLADLARLLDQFRASGLPVRFEESGTPVHLPAGAQLAVYRIVQEALTNALRHGDTSAETTVDFAWTQDGVDLSVRSPLGTVADGGKPQQGEGHGLVGMAERAALARGTFNSERTDLDFVVTASIPAHASEVRA